MRMDGGDEGKALSSVDVLTAMSPKDRDDGRVRSEFS